MTVIRILLIIGLVYIALQQKKETTRNIILVVTGLLAFCMMGKEGLMIPATDATCTGTATLIAATCVPGQSVNATDGAQCALVADLSTAAPCAVPQRASGSGQAGIPAPACAYTDASTPTCDLDAGTDGTAACHAGCSEGPASAARSATVSDFSEIESSCTDGKVIDVSSGACISSSIFNDVKCADNSWYDEYDATAKECV